MTAAELLFKIQTQGTNELDKVRTAVQGIGEGTRLAGAQLKTFDATLNQLVNSGKSFRQALEEMARSNGVLSSAVRQTANDLLTQMRAAEGDAEAIRKLSGTHDELVSKNIATGAALRDLNGAMNTRAIENFMSKMLGLGPIMQAAFPIVGAIAFGEMLGQLWEKIDPLQKAEKALAEQTKQLDGEYERLSQRLEKLQIEEITAKFGKLAGLKMEQFYADSAAQRDQTHIDNLSKKLTELQQKKATWDLISGVASLPVIGGVLAPLREYSNRQRAAYDFEATGINDQIQNGQLQQNVDKQQKATDATQQARAAADQQRSQNRAVDEYVKGKVNVTLDPIQKAFAEFAEFVQRFKDAGPNSAPLSAANRSRAYDATLTDVSQLLVNKYWTNRASIIKRETRPDEVQDLLRTGGAMPLPDYYDRNGKPEDKLDNKLVVSWVKQLDEDIKSMQHITAIQNSSDADGVRRGLAVQIHRNDTGMFTRGTAGAAGSDYAARIQAANAIYEIDTRGLDLIKDKDKQDEKYAEARKRREDEIFQAQMAYQEQLDTIRERDLERYRGEAGQLFDALTNRREGAGIALGQMARGAVTNFGRTVFQNASTGILQSAGHAVAGIGGTGNLGGLLNGTVFDSRNKGADQAVSDTAKNTARTADEVSALRKQLAGDPTAQPGTGTGTGTGAGHVGLPALSGDFGVPGGGLGKLLGGGSGSFLSGVGSALKGYGLSTALDPGMTTASRIGGAVGFGGELAGGAFGIMSGIHQGGAKGALTTAGSAAGTAAAVVSNVSKALGVAGAAMSAIPIVGSIMAAALPLIGSMFGDSKVTRQNNINKELSQNQFLAPTALNVTQSTNGTFADFDGRGMLRTSTLSAVPTVAEPYITSRRLNPGDPRTYYNAPGSTQAPFSGSAAGSGQAPVANTTIVVNAMDASSFHDYLQRNHGAVGEALATHLQNHEGRASNAIRNVV